jgi:hypothetical protein
MASKLGSTDDSMDMPARAAMIDIARRLGVGAWASQVCPSCLGGGSKERSMSVLIEQNGVIKWNCFRASCDFKGSAFTNQGIHTKEYQQVAVQRINNPLTADLFPLSDKDYTYFSTRYSIPESIAEQAIKRTESRYALPIFRPNGSVRGHITRRPWDGSGLDTADNRNDSNWAMKSLTYMDSFDEPVQSWYYSQSREPKYDTGIVQGHTAVVLVEDPISALRLATYMDDMEGDDVSYAVCALLGTGVNAGKVREIQEVARNSPVYIALDADATGQAFAMARKWGPGFRSLRVTILPKDIKDMDNDEIGALVL